MATVTAIPAIIQSLGADPVAVLAESGVNAELFNDPEHVISLAARNRMVEHCAERTGCAHFGLLVGQRNLLQSLGLVGALVRYSPDVGTALRSLALHHGVHVRGVKISLTVDGNIATLDWVTYEQGLDANDHVGDGAMACFCNIIGELCGPDWRPTEVWFAHRRPEDVAPFRQFFRVPLRFDAERFALLFPAKALERRLPQVDSMLHRLVLKEINTIEERHRGDFSQQVRSVLRTAILTGTASADRIAAIFGIARRTMNRRLRDCGVGFQQLIDEGRFEFAQQLLQDSSLDLARISEMLGYAAPGVFTRSFRRWSGTTPADWRAAHSSARRR